MKPFSAIILLIASISAASRTRIVCEIHLRIFSTICISRLSSTFSLLSTCIMVGEWLKLIDSAFSGLLGRDDTLMAGRYSGKGSFSSWDTLKLLPTLRSATVGLFVCWKSSFCWNCCWWICCGLENGDMLLDMFEILFDRLLADLLKEVLKEVLNEWFFDGVLKRTSAFSDAVETFNNAGFGSSTFNLKPISWGEMPNRRNSLEVSSIGCINFLNHKNSQVL